MWNTTSRSGSSLAARAPTSEDVMWLLRIAVAAIVLADEQPAACEQALQFASAPVGDPEVGQVADAVAASLPGESGPQFSKRPGTGLRVARTALSAPGAPRTSVAQ